MHIKYGKDAKRNMEFGCDLNRLYPWRAVADTSGTSWGTAIATVAPGESTVPHSHPEHETFIVVSGVGSIAVDSETERVTVGDTIYLPPKSNHSIANLSTEDPLTFLTIWWVKKSKTNEIADEIPDMSMSFTACATRGSGQ